MVLDISEFKVGTVMIGDKNVLKKRKRYKKFIGGAVPQVWVAKAIRAGCSAAKVGYVLWYLKYLKKSNVVRLTSEECGAWNISRQVKYAGLKQLAASGLIRVKQEKSRNPDVLIIEADAADAGQGGNEKHSAQLLWLADT
jgi:hypothetical protein